MLGTHKSQKIVNRKALASLSALASVVFVLALVPAANAQAPVTGYGGQGGVAGTVAGGNAGQSVGGERASGGSGNNGNGNVAGEAQASNDLLPFTGMDLLAIIGGGLVLLASGVLLSRIVVRDPA